MFGSIKIWMTSKHRWHFSKTDHLFLVPPGTVR